MYMKLWLSSGAHVAYSLLKYLSSFSLSLIVLFVAGIQIKMEHEMFHGL